MRNRIVYAIGVVAASGALTLGVPATASADSLVSVLNDNNVAANVCGNDVNAAVIGEIEDQNKTNCKNKINETDRNGDADHNGEDDSILGL